MNIIETITTLSNAGIDSPTFDENARSKIQCFITTYAHETLFTFSDENTIFVDFTAPKDVPKNTTYFIKLFNEEEENLSLDFSKIIIFGKIDQQVEATLISTLKMVFICSIYNMESIPYSMSKNENTGCLMKRVQYFNHKCNSSRQTENVIMIGCLFQKLKEL